MCGFGLKPDKRPLDPMPVVQVTTSNYGDGTLYSSILYNPYLYMNVTLWNQKNEKVQDYCFGSNVSSVHALQDTDGILKCFFIFPELCIRKDGLYELDFRLFEVVSEEIQFCASIRSNQFEV